MVQCITYFSSIGTLYGRVGSKNFGGGLFNFKFEFPIPFLGVKCDLNKTNHNPHHYSTKHIRFKFCDSNFVENCPKVK